jgi:hypothetical protein
MHRADTFMRLWPLYAICASFTFAQVEPPPFSQGAEVLKVEDAFRVAKLQNNIEALSQILADEYVGVNQYGSRRNKAEVLELFRDFKVSTLSRAEADVHLAGDIAIVVGSQREVNPAGKEQLIFTRVYIKRGGRWQLLSSTQLIPFNY